MVSPRFLLDSVGLLGIQSFEVLVIRRYAAREPDVSRKGVAVNCGTPCSPTSEEYGVI